MTFETVRALKRGLEILVIINLYRNVKAQDIARISGIPRPTVYRLLETLETLGFVNRSAEDTWLVTMKVKSLSGGFRDAYWVTQICKPLMKQLTKSILWPVDLITFDSYEMVVRESTHATSPFSVDIGMIGRRLPMLETSGGRAYLAFCPEPERKAIIERLAASDRPGDAMGTAPSWIGTILKRTREQGYAIRVKGFKSMTSSMSLPVYHGNSVIACLTVVWIASALDPKTAVERYLEPMRKTSALISEAFQEREGMDFNSLEE